MYKTSTYFIKEQLPGVTIEQILELYKRELEDQNVSVATINENELRFSNDFFKISLNRFANKFSGFSSGKISIEDTGSEYLVNFKADNSRMLVMAAILAVVVTFSSAMHSEFNLFSLIPGLAIFCLLSGIGYASTTLFSVYFVSVRNQIERQLQEHKQIVASKP